MFYHMGLTHDMLIHPRYFGPQIHQVVKEKLYRDVEGNITNAGFIVAITYIDDVGTGLIQCDTGMARYTVKYNAIVSRPIKGEVMEAIVKQINKAGIFAEIGSIVCFINHHSIPSHYTFHAEVPACYKSEGDEPVISVEEKIRVKIIGIRLDTSGLFTVGTLMDDYLGVIEA